MAGTLYRLFPPSVVLDELPADDPTTPYVVNAAEDVNRYAARVPVGLRAKALRNLCHYVDEQARRHERAEQLRREHAERIGEPWPPAERSELEAAAAGVCDGR